MKLPVVLLLVFRSHRGETVDLEVAGEVTFDLKVFNLGSVQPDWTTFDLKLSNSGQMDQSLRAIPEEKDLQNKTVSRTVTAAPVLECIYQYPEKEHIDAILSIMMNELTKVFVRAHDYFGRDARRRRRPETRFQVVEVKKTQFFEHIYYNMTHEFSEFYNSTADRVGRSRPRRDPCQHQYEIERLWRDLLDHSLTSFRRAALRCVEEHLKVQDIRDDTTKRERLGQFLIRELRKFRTNQLNMLCESFQLCYHELM